jgi:thiosulfate reductase cytochrome b subunit
MNSKRINQISMIKRLVMLAVMLAVFFLVGQLPVIAETINCIDDNYTECRGYRSIEYMVNDINALDRPYSYLIKDTKYLILELFGILAMLGAVGFAFLHGIGRFLVNRRNPITLIKKKSVFIYKLIIRLGHWSNALAVIALIVTGFIMHYIGPGHGLARIHNIAGGAFVVLWILFFLYEIATFDVKQYLVKGWELREGILKQALFYAIGIFKQEEHPYHMKAEARLNPLQKVAYFSVMFILAPLVGFTGMLLLDPNLMSPFVSYIGMENMKYVFIVHLAGAFGMVAYLLGHLYLGTTGDRIAQHYKVMITGQHDEYQRKSPETVQKQS